MSRADRARALMEALLPEISPFFEIVVYLYPNDHAPPHFHARYAGRRIAIDIRTLRVVRERVHPRALGLLVEWASLHRDELLAAWDAVRRNDRPAKIPPLGKDLGVSPSEMQDVVAVEHRGGHRLWLRFDDGVEGVLDFARLLKFRGMLAPLRDPTYFAKAFVDAESGSVTWPNDADLYTLVLCSKVTGRSIRSLLDNPPPRRRRKTARRRPAKV